MRVANPVWPAPIIRISDNRQVLGMDTKMLQLAELIQQSNNTIFFGGAGVSTESGIPDFRSESGIFATKQAYGYPPEELISHAFSNRNQNYFSVITKKT